MVFTEPEPPRRPRIPRRTVLTASGAGAVLVTTALAAGPRPARLGPVQGDDALATALEPHLQGHHRVAAAIVEGPDQDRWAGFGAGADTEFEIGSVTKTFTGALLMDAIDRGEVTLETTVQEVLGERAEGAPAADVTLAELASHSSGLPRLPMVRTLLSLPAIALRTDPYRGVSPDEVIDAALDSSVSDRGEYEYSNLGVAFLGHLLAERTGTSWHQLLGRRLLEPLDLTSTRAPAGPEELGADAPTGRTTSGLSTGAWTNPGYGPAGGIRSTAGDMTAYLRSMMDGSNPGTAGLDPLLEREEERSVAVAWALRRTDDGRTIISHNGMTGGFAAYCGWCPDDGRGIALMTATERDLDELGAAYLEGSVQL